MLVDAFVTTTPNLTKAGAARRESDLAPNDRALARGDRIAAEWARSDGGSTQGLANGRSGVLWRIIETTGLPAAQPLRKVTTNLEIPEHFRFERLEEEGWVVVGHGSRAHYLALTDEIHHLIVHLADVSGPALSLTEVALENGSVTGVEDGADGPSTYRFVACRPFSEMPKQYGRFWKAIERLERERMAGGWTPPVAWAKNRYILKWWSTNHDALVERLIKKHGFAWEREIVPREIRSLDEDGYDAWVALDPLCAQYDPDNVVRNFAVARSAAAGLDRYLPDPVVTNCAACGEHFDSRWIRADLACFGGGKLCSVCLYKAFVAEGDNFMERDQIKVWIGELVESLGRVPNQGVVTAPRAEVPPASDPRLPTVTAVLSRKPSREKIRQEFGSWFAALSESGAVDRVGQRLSRGTRCLAEDGHLCSSLGEKTVDDLLFRMGLPHEREPDYPEGRFRADFKIGETLVEFLGLKGDPAYDLRAARKFEVARRHGIAVLKVHAEDLADLERLAQKLQALA